jgi:hypothetical protein
VKVYALCGREFIGNKLNAARRRQVFRWEKKVNQTGEALVQQGVERTWQARHEIQVGDIFKLPSSTKLRLLLAKPLKLIVSLVRAKGVGCKKESLDLDLEKGSRQEVKYCASADEGISVETKLS